MIDHHLIGRAVVTRIVSIIVQDTPSDDITPRSLGPMTIITDTHLCRIKNMVKD